MPEWATQVEVDGPILFIDGQPFPWYTLGGVQTNSGQKDGSLPTITVTIPVDGMITFGVPERIGETQRTMTENRRRNDERLRAEVERPKTKK